MLPVKCFEGVDCEHSFFVFSKHNRLRLRCWQLANSQKFENFILGTICLSSVKLVWDTYLLGEPEDSSILLFSEALDALFTVTFTVEFLIKAVSTGFI